VTTRVVPGPKSGARSPKPILVLCFLLTIWNPASLALTAAAAVPSIFTRSTLSLFFLVTRLVLTSVGVAAGLALWLQKPGAVQLAKLSLMLFGIEAVARLSTRVNLSTAPPGTRLPLAVFIIMHNAAWYLYLQKSRRVRATYGLESQPRNRHL
jgi:hypothetical protein